MWCVTALLNEIQQWGQSMNCQTKPHRRLRSEGRHGQACMQSCCSRCLRAEINSKCLNGSCIFSSPSLFMFVVLTPLVNTGLGVFLAKVNRVKTSSCEWVKCKSILYWGRCFLWHVIKAAEQALQPSYHLIRKTLSFHFIFTCARKLSLRKLMSNVRLKSFQWYCIDNCPER